MQNVQNKGQIQNEFMRSSFLPEYQPKITKISTLPSNKLNLLLRVDKKTVRREELQFVYLCSILSYTLFIKKTKWFQITDLKIIFEWKRYMANIVCKE